MPDYAGMQACGRSVHEAIPHIYGANAIPTFFLFHDYHHLELNNQAIKPTVERLSYILHDTSISRDSHVLTDYAVDVSRRFYAC